MCIRDRKEFRKQCFHPTCQPVTAMGQLFDIVKNRRKRNVDGEVLANWPGSNSWLVVKDFDGCTFSEVHSLICAGFG